MPPAILDLSYGLPPFGRVPGFRMQIVDFRDQYPAIKNAYAPQSAIYKQLIIKKRRGDGEAE